VQKLFKDVSKRIYKQRRKPSNKNINTENDTKRLWNSRYIASIRCKQEHGLCCFKKTKELLTNINPKYAKSTKPLKIRLEMDEMWGRVYCKETPCWLWHAINHENGDVVAYVLGSREHEMLWELWGLIAELNIEIIKVYSDDNFAYHDIIPRNILRTGKRKTQKIERKHLTFRTRLKRLARKTICYSKSLEMHKIVFGLLINVLEFECQLF